MFDFLAGALAYLYDIWPSYGGAIALFTICVMLLLAPLAIKSTRSMIAMQRVGPELKKLQAKYKDDREALNREMMAFYKENNINPFSSCLPLLLQMPVFIVLYQVLSGLTRRSDGPESNFNPKYLEGDDTPLAVALRGTNEMVSFGMDLSKSALGTLQNDGLVTALPFILLVGIVVASTFVQQRQIAGRNTNAQANPQQQMLIKVMPFIFIPISVSIPAGVVIYFAVSNLVRIGQQAFITRLEYGSKGEKSPKSLPPTDVALTKDVKGAAPAKDGVKAKDPGNGENTASGKGTGKDGKDGKDGKVARPGAPKNRPGTGGNGVSRSSPTGKRTGGSTGNGSRAPDAGAQARSRKRKRK